MNNLKLWRFISLAFLSPIWCADDSKAQDAVATKDAIDTQSKDQVIEIFYGNIKDIKRKDIGKYFVQSVGIDRISALFKITGDFEDNWIEKCDMSDIITEKYRIFPSTDLEATLLYSKETSDNQPKLTTALKEPLAIKINFSYSKSIYYKFTDDHFTLIDNFDNIKSDDIGKCFFASLNGLPVLLKITCEMPLNWSRGSLKVKSWRSNEGCRLIQFLDADDQPLGSPFVIMFYGQ